MLDGDGGWGFRVGGQPGREAGAGLFGRVVLAEDAAYVRVVFGVAVGFAVEEVAGEGGYGVVYSRGDVRVPRHFGCWVRVCVCVFEEG